VGRQLAERPTECEMVSLLNNTEVTVTKAVRAETKDKLQAHIETVQLDIKAPLKASVELQDTKTEEARSDMNTYVDRLDTMIAPIQAAIIPLQADMYKTDNRVSEMTKGQLALEKTQTAMSENIHDIQHSVGSLQPCRVPRCSIRCKMLLTDHSTFLHHLTRIQCWNSDSLSHQPCPRSSNSVPPLPSL
jgi:hypothetical protein